MADDTAAGSSTVESDVERGGASTLATVDVDVDGGHHLALLAVVPYGTTERQLDEALQELEALLEREPNINLSPPDDRALTDGGSVDGQPAESSADPTSPRRRLTNAIRQAGLAQEDSDDPAVVDEIAAGIEHLVTAGNRVGSTGERDLAAVVATDADGTDRCSFTGTVVQDTALVILDDGETTVPVETDADVLLGEEVTVRGTMDDGRLVADAVDRLRADGGGDAGGGGGGKYTHPTGPGYLGVYRTAGSSVNVPIGVWEHLPWRSDDDLWAVREDLNGQTVVAVVDEEPADPVCPAVAKQVTVGTSVTVPACALRELRPTFIEEVRVYRRAGGGFYVVPRRSDPTLTLSPDHPQLVADPNGPTDDQLRADGGHAARYVAVEFRSKRRYWPRSFFRPSVVPGEMGVSCALCGYWGVVDVTGAVEDAYYDDDKQVVCADCGDQQPDHRLIADGGTPADETSDGGPAAHPAGYDLGRVWYVVADPRQDPARVVDGPIQDRDSAKTRASIEPGRAEVKLGIWLVYNIREEDYRVEWAEDVDRPAALVAADGGLASVTEHKAVCQCDWTSDWYDDLCDAKDARYEHEQREHAGEPMAAVRTEQKPVSSDGGSNAPISWGPHSCPYGPEYDWWRTSDGMFVAGHQVIAICGYCGGEMPLVDVVDGQAFLFECPVCTHFEQTVDDERVERPVPLEVAPTDALALDEWQVTARGRDAETDILDDAIRAVIDVDAGPDAFMLRSPTLFTAGRPDGGGADGD